MYQPKLHITYKVLNNLIEFEKLNQELLLTQVNPNTETELLKAAKSLSLFHLAHLIGVELSLKDAEKAALGNKITTDDARGTIINNYRNVYEYIHSSTPENLLHLDLNLLLHFNKILLSEWQDSWNVKIRTANDQKDAYLDSWSSLVDPNIEPLKLQNEILELIDWYKFSQEIQTILKLSVFLYRMIQLAPFAKLNKITFIALIEFLFFKGGYQNIRYIPLTRVFDLGDQVLFQSMVTVNNSFDATPFIEQFTESLLYNIQDTKARVKRLLGQQDKIVTKPFLDLNKRQLKILRYLQTIPTVRREDYVQMMDVSPMTSFRDLSELVSKKLLKVEGQGRATKYMLVNR